MANHQLQRLNKNHILSLFVEGVGMTGCETVRIDVKIFS
jgi:hypothetical protein